jgi:purine-nucleoside phosphorylase
LHIGISGPSTNNKLNMKNDILESISAINKVCDYSPEVAIILGSGLGGLAETIENKVEIPYSAIPHFPESTVAGHKGCLVLGNIAGKRAVAMQGRFHYYEGYGMEQICYPVRVMQAMGARALLVSNAAGGLNPEYLTGDLMLIKDHINFFPAHPLRGPNDESAGPRFPDMSKTYSAELRQIAKDAASQMGIKLHEGVYIGSSGPSLETPAEYRMMRILGADATGMSTVPEIIAAYHSGMRCMGISVITNQSVPSVAGGETSHDEVIANAQAASASLGAIFAKVIEKLSTDLS